MKRGVRRFAVAFTLIAGSAFASDAMIVFSPQVSAPRAPVTATISGLAKNPTVTVTGVTITGNTITIDAVSQGAVCGPACLYSTEADFQAPGQPGVYTVEYWLTFGRQRTLDGTAKLTVANVCDFGHSLTADPPSVHLGGFGVTLRWCNPGYALTDSGYFLQFYRVYSSHAAEGPFTPLLDVPVDRGTSVIVDPTAIGTTYYYVEAHGCMGALTGCRANAPDTTVTSNIVSVRSTIVGFCTADATTLCLDDGRFAVTARWQTADGRTGDGHPVALTKDSGYFWFFDRNNVEVTMKVLDACSLQPASFWVFGAGMTNVAVELTVTDMQAKVPKRYSNGQGRPFQPIVDTLAFFCP